MDGSRFEWLREWPKVELHRHLEATLTIETAWELAQAAGAVSADESLDRFVRRIRWDSKDPPNFETFLGKFNFLRRLYTSREAVERVTREAVVQAASEGIRYLELRFNPDHFAETAGFAPAEVAGWILAAGAAAAQAITVRFLLTINRTHSPGIAEETLAIALANRDSGIAGLDLAGNELAPDSADFAPLFRQAAAAGLGVTVHAGEVGSPARVWEALDRFHAVRIGHGIRSVRDPALIRTLAARRVALEICPTSNLQTGAAPGLAAHPLAALYRAGVPVTLNTDDPGISGITLTSEYELALASLGLTPSDLREMILTAAEHAFLPPQERSALRIELERALGQAPHPELPA